MAPPSKNSGRPAGPASGGFVRGYVKNDGTRVAGYYRQAPSGGGVLPTAAQAQAARAVKGGGAVRKRED